VTARTIQMQIAPRLNAPGRMGDPAPALDLLLATAPDAAQAASRQLEAANARRQQLQGAMSREAGEALRAAHHEHAPILFLAREGWSSGLIGIVAGRLVSDHGKPAILIAIEGETCRGSARSVAGFHIAEALRDCSDLLIRSGGHELAAGFDVARSSIELLGARLAALAADRRDSASADPGGARQLVDAELQPADVTSRLVEEVALLQPFGEGNPEPTFGATLRVLEVGRWPARDGGEQHLKLRLGGDGMRPMDAVHWRHGDLAGSIARGDLIDVCFALEVNAWRGAFTPRIKVLRMRPAESPARRSAETDDRRQSPAEAGRG
jgi:single-stranded-DNA-specific exonuclease